MQNNGNIPAVVNRPLSYVVQPAPASYAQMQPVDGDGVQPAVPLARYLWILRRHRWKISGFVGRCRRSPRLSFHAF